jgi:uncharacterized repeat protein (TIGR01451 family)
LFAIHKNTIIRKKGRKKMFKNILLTKILMMLIITIFITLIIPYAMTAHANPNIITFKADRELDEGDPHCQDAPGGLLVDNDSDGVADPGDTLGYAVCIVNSGNMDATNVSFNDTIDANTTLQGTFKTTPIARNDIYNALGNVGITVPADSSGVLANDNDPDGTEALPTIRLPVSKGAIASTTPSRTATATSTQPPSSLSSAT